MMISRPSPGLFATGLATALSALVVSASAASLGGISVVELFTWSAPVTISIPDDIAADDFACSGSLHGQSDSQGNVWADHGGDWQCLGSGEVRGQRRVAHGHVTVDLGVSDQLKVSTLLTSVSSQPGRSGPGISFFSDGLSHMYAVYQRDMGRVTLGKREVLLDTVIATAPISDRADAEISVEIDQPMIRVLVDGVAVITHTMSGTESVVFGSSSRFGLEADNDNQSRFDSFWVETS